MATNDIQSLIVAMDSLFHLTQDSRLRGNDVCQRIKINYCHPLDKSEELGFERTTSYKLDWIILEQAKTGPKSERHEA